MNALAVDTPAGRLTLVGGDRGLRALLWPGEPLPPDATTGPQPLLAAAARQLEEYFAGARRRFDVALDVAGTPFQQRVWDAVSRIPFGTTTSYGELARRLGLPAGARAVGAANGRNPVGIVVPCHRLVGARGELTGYAGGLHVKELLLVHEARVLDLEA